jgi:hypothetical protein
MKNLINIIILFFLQAFALAEPPLLPGWPVLLDAGTDSCPAILDIDGDGDNEVIIGTEIKNTYVFMKNGAPAPGWPKPYWSCSAAVADIDNDGLAEIFIGSKGGVYAFHSNGTLVDGWPNLNPEDIIFGVAIDDLNHDGILEISAGTWDGQDQENSGKHYLWEPSGELYPGWPKKGKKISPWSLLFYGPPALGDIDGDGYAEIVAATTDSIIEVWNYDGSKANSFPKELDAGGITAAPVLGDVDGDGKLEIIIGTEGKIYGNEFKAKVFVINEDGSFVPGWPKELPHTVNNQEAALGDVDNDGKPEIFVSLLNQIAYLWNGEDGSPLPGWPIIFQDPAKALGTGTAIGDIDGDGEQEILKPIEYYGYLEMYAWNIDTSIVEGFPFSHLGESVTNSEGPTIADLNGDGKVDYCQGSEDSSSYFNPAYVYCWTHYYAQYNPTKMEWPTFHHDAKRTGRYHNPTVPPPIITDLEPKKGSTEGGEMVKIIGQNFKAGANVFFGGVKSPHVFFISNNELIAQTPKRKPALVNVVVVNLDQQYAVLRDSYEFIGNLNDNILLQINKQNNEAVLTWQGGAPLYKVLRGKLQDVSTGLSEPVFLSHRMIFHDSQLNNPDSYFYIVQ